MQTYILFLQFTDNHPFIGLVWGLSIISSLVGVLHGIYSLISWPFKLINRRIRHANIKAAGWPPPWSDADGDWHEGEYEDGPEEMQDRPEPWKTPDL